MRRFSLALAAVAAMFAFAAASVSAAPPSDNGPGDFVTGSTKRALLPPMANQNIHVEVSAHSNADGTDPKGQIHFKNDTTKEYYDGDVQCVRVGNAATDKVAAVGIRITRSNLAIRPVGAGIYWFFSDNGQPNPGGPDDAAFSSETGVDPTNCPVSIGPFNRPTFAGNYVIRDSQ
jgi:hypothetical protein